MISAIIPQPTWKVIDGTKLNTYITCPRKFFYEFILGWRPLHTNHNLYFGLCFHIALEYMYGKWQKRGVPGYQASDIPGAYEIFFNEYRKQYDPDTDTSHKYKTPENVLRILMEYINLYQDDAFEVIETEISGSVPIGYRSDGSTKDLYFRLDLVTKLANGMYDILEHKISSWRLEPWAESWPLSIQAGTGTHALYCVYPSEEVKGITYNGFFFRAVPKRKKNGELYANAGSGNEFLRIPIHTKMDRLQWWLGMVNGWYDRVERDMDVLDNETEDQSTMEAFPCSGNCFEYGERCPYYDMCCSNANPLKELIKPEIFKEEHWDPRDADKESTHNVGKVEMV